MRTLYVRMYDESNQEIGRSVLMPMDDAQAFQYGISYVINGRNYGRNPNNINASPYQDIIIPEALDEFLQGAGMITDLAESPTGLPVTIGCYLSLATETYYVCKLVPKTKSLNVNSLAIPLDESLLTGSYLVVRTTPVETKETSLQHYLLTTESYNIMLSLKELGYDTFVANFDNQKMTKINPMISKTAGLLNAADGKQWVRSMNDDFYPKVKFYKLGDTQMQEGQTYQCIANITADTIFNNSKDWIQL